MNNEFDKEQTRGLFATTLLAIFVSALFAGDRVLVFPPNFLVPFLWPISLLIPALIVSFKSIAVTYVVLWIVYAFAMSLAYSDSGARLVLGRYPRILGALGRWRITHRSLFLANLSFIGGMVTVGILGALMALWWIRFLLFNG